MAPSIKSGVVLCRYRRSAAWAEVELGELVGELSKEPLAGLLEAADAAHVCNLSSAEPLWELVNEEVVEQHGAAVLDARHDF